MIISRTNNYFTIIMLCMRKVEVIDRIRLNSLSQRFDKSYSLFDSPKMDTIAKIREQSLKEAENSKGLNNT